MSVEVSHNPRFYNRGQGCGIQNPPECYCNATLLDRKFIATQGIPPPVDAERLVRNLDIHSDAEKHFSLRVFRDRILLSPLSRGPTPPEIYLDDIIQIEILNRHSEIVFILCGRISVAVYYIFKLANEEVGEQIKRLTKNINPNLISGYQSLPLNPKYGHSDRPRNQQYYNNQQQQHRQYPSRFSPAPSLRRGPGNRDISAPPSAISDESSLADERPLARQNSFIRWEGYRGSRRNQGPSRPWTSGPRKSPKAVRSSPHSPRRRNSDTTLFIKAHGKPARRKVATSRTKPKARILIETKSRESDRSATQSVDNHRKPVTMEVSKPRPQPKKLPKPRTFILETSKSRKPIISTPRQNLIYSDYDSESDPDNEVQVGRHRYTAGYGNGPTDDYDWESEDSWDVMEERALANARGVSFNVPRPMASQPSARMDAFGHREEEFDDDMSSTTEDSLYFEQEQQMSSRFAPRPTNYLPELQEKFHKFNLK